VDDREAVLLCVEETRGTVGRTRLTQILRGGRARDLLAAGHHKLESHARLAHRNEAQVLEVIDRLIADGTLVKTDGRYPVVRRGPAGG
jgi:ATP-dependent DNA helicase RecQ